MSSKTKGMDYDPTQPETFDSVYEEFARLRRSCPVAHSDAYDGFWVLAKYKDVKSVLSQPRKFTTKYKNVVPVMSLTSRRPPLHLDPPEHTPYRRALDRVLGADRIAALQPFIRSCAERLMANLVSMGAGDLVRDYTRRLPVEIFGEWFGLEPDQTDVLQATSQAYVDAWEAADLSGVQAAGLTLTRMAEDVVADRSKNPRNISTDPVSSLLSMTYEGERFPHEKVVGCVRQVLVVGLVAPPIFLGSVGVHLSRHPELQQELRSDTAKIPAAVEEFLRLYTPYRGFARTAREPVEIGGRSITPEEPIAMLYASANRDEDIFANPDEFRLNRPNISKHLAFGLGPHSCAGVRLARAELIVGLEELLKQTSHFEVTGDVVMSGMPEVGPVAVPIRLTRAVH